MKKRILLLTGFVIIMTFILSCSRNTTDRGATTAESTETATVLTDGNGNAIPVYDDVSLTELDPSLFKTDEYGRMLYADPSVPYYTGIDVSVHQGDIDWEKVKADGIDFVMLRAGCRGYGPSGLIYEDENFKKNCEAANLAGLKVGAYFFSQAITVEEAEAEADFMIDILKDQTISFPVAFDWESIYYDTARTDGLDNETITQCALRFCNKMESAGYRPIIYFSLDIGYFSYDLSILKNHHFWLAEYKDTPSFIYNYRIWQYTEKGSVDGIAGNVDMNIAITNFS